MSPIATATRNIAILAWWADCQPGFKLAARAQFVAAFGWPDCELGTMEEFAQDQTVIDWLARTYPETIAAHEDDSL